MDVAVGGERGQVDTGERKGQRAEEAMQVQQPGGTGGRAEEPAGQRQPPDDRRGDQCPAHQAAGAGEIPPHLLVHTSSSFRVGVVVWFPAPSTSSPATPASISSRRPARRPASSAVLARTSASHAWPASTVTWLRSLRAGAPVVGSIRWCWRTPPRSQVRAVGLLVATAPSDSATLASSCWGRSGRSIATTQPSPPGALPTTRRSPPRLTQAPCAPRPRSSVTTRSAA